MSLAKWLFKMLLSIAFDLMDFFVGRIPIIGTGIDFIGGFFGMWLWGGLGSFQFIEIFDFSDQIDAFVPTLTIVGLLKGFALLFKK